MNIDLTNLSQDARHSIVKQLIEELNGFSISAFKADTSLNLRTYINYEESRVRELFYVSADTKGLDYSFNEIEFSINKEAAKYKPNKVTVLHFSNNHYSDEKIAQKDGVEYELVFKNISWLENQIGKSDNIQMKYGLGFVEPIKAELRYPEFESKRLFLAEYRVGSQDLSNRFIKEGLWYTESKQAQTAELDEIERGDILLLKSVTRSGNEHTLSIRAIGVLIEKGQNEFELKVQWLQLSRKITLPDNPIFTHILALIGGSLRNLVIQKISESRPEEVQSKLQELDVFINREKLNPNFKKDSLSDFNAYIEYAKNFWWIRDVQGKWKGQVGSDVELKEESFDYKRPDLGDLVITFYPTGKRLLSVIRISKGRGSTIIGTIEVVFSNHITLEQLIQNRKLFESGITEQSRLNAKISREQFEEILKVVDQKKTPNLNNYAKIAQFNGDGIGGQDYLDIRHDVTAFAKIIASNSFAPPLAIALFGKWGTGKSFFMRKLWERIEYYASSGGETYNSGIVQIHFNAWSYMDANLWASLVGQIFENLNKYINDKDSISTENKKLVQEKFQSELKSLTDQRKRYEEQISTYRKQILQLHNAKGKEEEEINKKINRIRSASLGRYLEKVEEQFKVDQRIEKAFKGNTSLQATVKIIEKYLPDKYRKNPEAFYQEAKSNLTFFRTFFGKENIVKNLIASVIIAATIIGVPVLFDFLSWFQSIEFRLIPNVFLPAILGFVPVWQRIMSNYNQLQPVINSFWQIKQDYDIEKLDAVKKYEQHIDSLKISIEKRQRKSQLIQEQIIEMDTAIDELEFKLENFVSTETLHDFIEQRAKGDVYKKHLSLISTIRSDFEVLSELFVESDTEQKHPEFRKYFKRPLQRIVLYIDDLDRCPEKRVVEVLEAVNLIMAFPLFVVVVGVDPRWVTNALIKEYHMQFHDQNKASKYKYIDPIDYLEKIFQIPFHLNEAEDNSVKEMLRRLSSSKTNSAKGLKEVEKRELLEQKEENVFADQDGVELVDQDGSELMDITLKAETPEDDQKEEYLSLSDNEIDLIQDFSGIIGSNPRAIKRFVNVYHILRAHESLKIDLDKPLNIALNMFLLSLPMGQFRELYGEFLIRVEESVSTGQHQLLSDFFQGETHVDLKKQLEFNIRSVYQIEPLMDIPLDEFYYYNQFIKRFTFSHTT